VLGTMTDLVSNMTEHLFNATNNPCGLHHHGQAGQLEIFFRSVALVGAAEFLDKTWFMGLLLALRYDPTTVFIGSYSALFIHTILAAAMGYAFARFLSPVILAFLTAALFFIFACMYAKDWYEADPDKDAIQAGKEDAAEDGFLGEGGSEEGSSLKENAGGKQAYMNVNDDDIHSDSSTEDASRGPKENRLMVLWQSFLGVFIAEWGDRTQIAMIGQHASNPLIPVFAGSCVAFFLLTLSAVGAAICMKDMKLREKVVMGFSACCFALFAVLALRDAFIALNDDRGTLPLEECAES